MADTQKFLKFKMGEYKNLSAADYSAGTVYITTDEQAMYVDVSNEKRIRINSSVLVFESLEDFKKRTAPPYNSDAIYYIANSNALMRWDATANNNAGEWVQLNATAKDVQSAISTLTEAVNSNAKKIKDNESAIEKNAEDIADLKIIVGDTEVGGSLVDRVVSLETAVDTVEGKVSTLEGEMDTVEGKVSTLEGEMDTVQGSVRDNTNAIESLADAIGADDAAGSLANRVKVLEGEMDSAQGDIIALDGRTDALETEVDNIETAIGADGTVGSIKGRIKSLEDELDDVQDELEGLGTDLSTNYVKKQTFTEAITGINTEIGTNDTAGSIKGRITSLESRTASLETRAGNLEAADVEIKKDIVDLGDQLGALSSSVTKNYVATTDFNNAVTRIDGEIDDINGVIGDSLVTGTTISSRVTALESAVSDAESDISTLSQSVKDNESAIEKNAGDITALTSRVSTVEGTVSNHGTRLTQAEGTISQHTTALSGHDTAIQNLTTDLDNAEKEISDNANAIEALAGALGDDATAGSIKNRITTLEGEMDTAQANITSLDGRLGTAEGKITTAEGNITTLQSDLDIAEKAIKDIEDSLDDFATNDSVDQIKTDLIKDINDHIAAANAMTYKGGVDDASKLPTTGVKVGDTYVVTAAFNGNLPGDLLVAKGDETGEGEDAVITSNLGWDRVITGYDASLNPSLKAVGNNIQLVDYTGTNEIGAVKLATDAANSVTITTDAANNTINLSIEWGTF